VSRCHRGPRSTYQQGRIADEPVARERLRDVVRDEFAIDLPEGPFVFEAPGPVQLA
jgi:hypothetical protein